MKKLRITKIIVVFIVILNIFTLTGCWNYTEINQQLNIAGFAVDKGQNGKKYHISVEIIATGKSANNNESEIVEADGDTLFDAVRSMISVTSKKLYFGHCKVLIIGEDIAKDGIAHILDFMYRDAEARVSINVLITKDCTGKDILMSEGVDNNIISYEMDDLIKTCEKTTAKSFRLQVYEIINILKSPGIDLIVPSMHLTTVEDFETFASIGCGIFNEDRLVGYITLEERKLFIILNNKISSGILNLEIPAQEDSFMAFEVYGSKADYKPRIENGNLVVDINITTDVFIGEMDSDSNYTTKPQRQTMALLLEQQMEKDINHFLLKLKKEFNSDILGIGMIINNDYPEIWQKYKDNWSETYKNLDTNINYKVNIRGSGISKSSIGKGG